MPSIPKLRNRPKWQRGLTKAQIEHLYETGGHTLSGLKANFKAHQEHFAKTGEALCLECSAIARKVGLFSPAKASQSHPTGVGIEMPEPVQDNDHLVFERIAEDAKERDMSESDVWDAWKHGLKGNPRRLASQVLDRRRKFMDKVKLPAGRICKILNQHSCGAHWQHSTRGELADCYALSIPPFLTELYPAVIDEADLLYLIKASQVEAKE